MSHNYAIKHDTMSRPRKSTRKHWPGKLLNCNRWIINREKLIALAQKAGFTIEAGKAQGTIIVEGDGGLCETTLGAFAELVAAAERQACIEACAEVRVIVNGNHKWTGLHVQEQCIDAIISRSNK